MKTSSSPPAPLHRWRGEGFVHLIAVLCIMSVPLMAQNNYSFLVQAKIENGMIEGLYDTKTGLQLYFGIPFAKPPVGDLRWRAPQAVDNWKGVLATQTFGPRPVQGIVFGDMNSRSNGISEDCLYLNVWTPAKRNKTGLP